MPEVGNYTVRIQNEETQEFFEEHQTKTTGDKTECYIVSKTGEKFSISCNLSDDTQSSFPKIAFLFEIHVDGHRVEECLDGKLGRNYLKTGQVRGISVARDREAPFLFGLTCFTEDGMADKTLLSNLGSIVIKVFQVIAYNAKYESSTMDVCTPEELKVSERAKKALLTHSVKYGEAKPVCASSVWDVRFIDDEENPHHTFTFFYRNKGTPSDSFCNL